MIAPRNVMILASAGSGKTYALTSRFVQLLAAGARPERIVALTFTRKAAGEFFDEILHKLARAARDEVFAARLAHEIERPALGAADFRQMLRDVVDAMHRLRLGTLDGFFARIACAFPLELGLTGEFEVLQEHALRVERRRVLQRIFARAPAGLDAAQREFIEAFKRATFGTEEKRLGARLDGFLDEHQETFLAAPDGGVWGVAARIWPGGCEWLEPAEKDLNAAVADLRAALSRRGLTDKQLARWNDFFDALPEWTPSGTLPKPVEYLVTNALKVWADVRRGCAEIMVERKRIALTPEECADLATIVQHLLCAEFTRRMEMTRGIHAVLRGYEAVYHDAVRRAGKLTFGDVQRLLGDGGTAERFEIDYRLDAQFDHWLLDEFQDTSFGQWSILRNLIDEAVQDAAGARSFFCVGDVKQAIFAWREGDPRLFREIFEHYNRAASGTIAERHLVESFRSGPAIIELVNAVFGRGEALAQLFPGPASDAWNREWRDHRSAQPGRDGHAAWLHSPGGAPGDDEAGRFALTLQLLLELAPLERGLTCAVLTRTNTAAAELADFLRREGGIPALAESDLRVCTDNPLGAALLALAQAAAHPGDTLAQEHWRMTPLRDVLAAEGIAFPEQWTERFLAQVHADGFERTFEFWLRRVEARLAPDDAFSRERGRQFIAAAALFDETGSRDVAEFIAFMERHTMRDAEVAGVVRVMTIHKSKGLGFDVVIVPDLEGQRIDQRRDGLAVQRATTRTVDWVFDLPPKLFYAQDETLSAHVQAAEADACYEALSLLYVALTRAKRALYVITKPVASTSESRNYPRLLTNTLGGGAGPLRIGKLAVSAAWSAGEPAWHEAVPLAAAAESSVDKTPTSPARRAFARATRRMSRRASADKGGVVSAAQLFALDGGGAGEFGTDVHALFAEIEWFEPADAARIARAWDERGVSAEAAAEAWACLRGPALASLWQRPVAAARVELWRERSFEMVLRGLWVTGVFDRVAIERDAAGRTIAARVIDFKTDQVADEPGLRAAIERHAPQLEIYREVAAALAGVPLSAVTCELVFTRLRRSFPVIRTGGAPR